MTVTAPGSWQAPPLPRQQHLLPRGTRLARGTYLAKCAPGLSCIETFSSSCTRKGLPRKQLASSLSRRADGSINKAQASSSSPSPIPPCLPPPFHLPKARRRRASSSNKFKRCGGGKNGGDWVLPTYCAAAVAGAGAARRGAAGRRGCGAARRAATARRGRGRRGQTPERGGKGRSVARGRGRAARCFPASGWSGISPGLPAPLCSCVQ